MEKVLHTEKNPSGCPGCYALDGFWHNSPKMSSGLFFLGKVNGGSSSRGSKGTRQNTELMRINWVDVWLCGLPFTLDISWTSVVSLMLQSHAAIKEKKYIIHSHLLVTRQSNAPYMALTRGSVLLSHFAVTERAVLNDMHEFFLPLKSWFGLAESRHVLRSDLSSQIPTAHKSFPRHHLPPHDPTVKTFLRLWVISPLTMHNREGFWLSSVTEVTFIWCSTEAGATRQSEAVFTLVTHGHFFDVGVKI